MCRTDRRRDAGMTLVEMIVTMAVIGAIVIVLATAATVTFRQQADTEGSLGVARWEQALALWLPTDLASADPNTIDKDPTSSPAACTDCGGSSNALTLSYDDGSVTTTVSYRYGPADDGEGFVLRRVECQSACSSRVVLRDLAEPTTAGWLPGQDAPPPSVIDVSGAAAVDAGATPCDLISDPTCPVTVTVSVNGLPDGAGVARNSMVSVTAGGVTRELLDTPTFEGPSFIEARSGCGGPVSLVVDRSGSINNARVPDVRRGVESFVRAFEGTPTRLQVVIFDSGVVTVGAASPTGYHTYDLSEPSDVTALVGSDSTETDGDFSLEYSSVSGATNWQEALARVFYTDTSLPDTSLWTSFANDGDPTTEIPELVVLFTDGLPNGHLAVPVEGDLPAEYRFPDANQPGQDYFKPNSWAKADSVVDVFRSSVDFVGVGIGPAFDRSVRVNRPGWPNGAWNIPNRAFLGDLIAGFSNPAAYDPAVGEQYSLIEYNGGWGDVSGADVLSTDDMAQLGSALAAIALAECGGTLTVQTRDSAGDPADADLTYTLGGEQVTTSRFNKSGTFDVPFGATASADIALRPGSLVGTGYTATGWSCAAGGTELVQGTDFTLIDPTLPGEGITMTLTPNAAVSCTLEVS